MPVGFSFSTPSILGIEGPKISASISPTLAPLLLKASARFAATVDFPTPPLPEAMATILCTLPRLLNSSDVFTCFGEVIMLILVLKLLPNFSVSIFSQAFLMDDFSGSLVDPKTRSNVTPVLSKTILLTSPNETMSNLLMDE
jgi:hypothetical protein